MDPQKFGDSYDFVKSVPRQSFLPARCLKSNVTKLQSYKVSWRIQPRNWKLDAVVGKTRCNASANLTCAFGMRRSALLILSLIHTRIIT